LGHILALASITFYTILNVVDALGYNIILKDAYHNDIKEEHYVAYVISLHTCIKEGDVVFHYVVVVDNS